MVKAMTIVSDEDYRQFTVAQKEAKYEEQGGICANFHRRSTKSRKEVRHRLGLGSLQYIYRIKIDDFDADGSESRRF